MALFILSFGIITVTVIWDIIQAGYYVSFLIAFLTIGFFLLFRYRFVVRDRSVISDDCLKKLQIIAHVISFLLMLVIVWYGQVELTWDWGRVIRTAYRITTGNYNDDIEYYLRYPNNQFWLAVLTVYFKTVQQILPGRGNYLKGLKYASALLSISFVRLSILCFYLGAKMSFGTRHARVLDIALLSFGPIYLYAGFAYTDTFGLLCVSLLILSYLKLRTTPPTGRKYYLLLILYALAAALTFRGKVMSFIVFLATILEALLHQKTCFRSAVRQVSVSVLLCALFIVVLPLPIQTFTLLPNDRSKKEQFPPIHWIVMGFNHYGGYDWEDVEYSIDLESYDARKAALQARLVERLKNRTFLENIRFIFHKELNRTWGNPLLAGDDYMSRSALFPESFVQRFWGWYGDLHEYCLVPAFAFWLILLSGCLLSGVFSWKSGSLDYLQLSVLGVFVFLSFWECNSRYLFTFTPAIFMCAYSGWLNTSSWAMRNTT